MSQPTELQLQAEAMLASARLTAYVASAGVVVPVAPQWVFEGGLATGRFTAGHPDSLLALDAWRRALPAGYRPSHRAIQTDGGERIEYTVAIRIGDVSVHLIASSPTQLPAAPAYRRELVTA